MMSQPIKNGLADIWGTN